LLRRVGGIFVGVGRRRLRIRANGGNEHDEHAEEAEKSLLVAAYIESGTGSHGPPYLGEGRILQRFEEFWERKMCQMA
jgi:hypothetical protein